MSRCGDIFENKVTGERAVVLRGDEDGHGQSGLAVCRFAANALLTPPGPGAHEQTATEAAVTTVPS